ncbi:MAG: hypothetical protein IKC32_00170 [Clostridia bacterium]|nr:hypothetical protein [Clostridia bacterium]
MKNKIKPIAAIAFVTVEAILGVIIWVTELNVLPAYLAVVLAALFVALFSERSQAYFLTQVALLFTLAADYYLLVIDDKYEIGMLWFILAQLCYFARIYLSEERKSVRIAHLVSRCGGILLSLLLPFLILGDGVDLLSVVSVVYFVNILLNAIFAFISFKRSPMLALGLLLFVACDIFVALANLGGYIKLGGELYLALKSVGFNRIAWLFYVPSQTLIALSGVMLKEHPRS